MANLTAEQKEFLNPTLVQGGKTYKDVNNDVVKPVETFPSKLWWGGFLIALSLLGLLGAEIAYLISTGIGIIGINTPVSWGSFIITFVFWIGIGHAGTLISAILFVFRQQWRMAINRSAEAMTIFAVACAGIFPLIHVGRPWLVMIWFLPLPNERGTLWPNFRSPLLWDMFAISTYLITSLVFWYIGLIPDFASIRDRVKESNWWQKTRKAVYSVLSFGWVGSTRAWSHYEATAMILAGLSMPLVFSVHTIVSFDFATSVIPGWHTTIFPPYFVAGAVFSGFGMVLTLLIVMREVFNFKEYITIKHLENMAKVVTLTGSMVGLAYSTEFFIAWYSGSMFEGFAFLNRAFGPYWWSYWIMVSCNVISPQLFWFKKLRTNPVFLWIVSIFVNIGMWFERYVIVVTSLHRDYLPSSWDLYIMTPHEFGILLGSFGLFFTLFLLYARFFPAIAMAEVKTIIKSPGAKGFGH
ncbi:NrfD/PsrC family molybdoenzyme membrane anchor subunit [Leptonema illini]|uniref:Quinol:cytochrome c oxidoreductase quinone-binding subunit 1 n=1 Tax=Leptonema illini DSM 21528 TaxID=929563 RepID=H2CCW3_9LEPT|nr:NrfD/PsrC family molybdoenzyme membrane anchor subunit [Leptonema illini]EHQ06433.1 quinol:cytochrome c oxidoreductase quinone-binding subunit 1 [Leptonema illini DSM 21528]